MQAHLAVGIEDAQRHPVDVQVDAAVKRVLNRVESHRVSSLLRGMGIHRQDTEGASVCQKEEAFIIINTLQRTEGTAALYGSAAQPKVGEGSAPAAEPYVVRLH